MFSYNAFTLNRDDIPSGVVMWREFVHKTSRRVFKEYVVVTRPYWEDADSPGFAMFKMDNSKAYDIADVDLPSYWVFLTNDKLTGV